MSDAHEPQPTVQPVREVTSTMLRGGFYNCMPVLRSQRISLHNQGYEFISEQKPRSNGVCGCGSLRKFKHCCESNIVRRAGATWFKPGASKDSRRML